MKEQIQKVENLIKAEVNIKQLEYISGAEEFIKKKIKPNFKSLGSKLGSSMKEAAAYLNNFSQSQIAELEQTGKAVIQLSSDNYEISSADVEISAEDIPGWSVASKSALTVALDTTITNKLKQEGNAREFVNRIQNIRKDNGFEVTDRILVDVFADKEISTSLIEFKNYICAEILADDIHFLPEFQEGIEIDVNDSLLKVRVNKKG